MSATPPARHTPRPSRSIDLATLLPRAMAERFDVAPIAMDGATIVIAAGSVHSRTLEQDLEFSTGRTVRIEHATSPERAERRKALYGDSSAQRVVWADSTNSAPSSASAARGGVVELLDRLIATALVQRASDVHLDPRDGTLVVRYRIDGILRDIEVVPAESTAFVLSRLKILAGLDIADRVRPQDGRAAVQIDGRAIDLRVSTLPLGAAVEKAVIRLLDSAGTVPLDQLGLGAGERYQVEKLLAQTEGLVLVTGPTGSGKTTTLYSMLRATQSRETNVVTVEDPIEYRLDGINQVQVNERAGLTFASALRSILRQDPDVVLVGEIRDGETAGIAIKASMTGHLVLSTLHTNDAASAVARLFDIGAEAGALASALRGVVAQRLVRKLCVECARPVRLDELPPEQQILLVGKQTHALRAPVGCPACEGSGYRGRTVVAEVLVVTDELRRVIARRAEPEEIQRVARAAGARSLWDAGVQRVLDGVTSIHELLDTIASPVANTHMPTQVESAQSSVDAILAKMRGESKVEPTGPARTVSSEGIVKRITGALRVITRRAPPALGQRVLIVHDDHKARRALRESLESEGFSVIEAHDGEAALAYARKLRPDVVITEIAVPKLDAVGLLQALSLESLPPRVVVYTEQRDEAMLSWLRELHAEVVQAPAERGMLATCLHAVAARKAA